MALSTQRETTTITFRVPVEFKKRLDDDAAEAALSRSALIISRVFGEAAGVLPTRQKRIPFDIELLRRILGQQGKIGSNLNQIARFVNSTDSFDSEKFSLKIIEHYMKEIRKTLLRMVRVIR